MSNTAKVAKEPKTNGFAFFSLIDQDDVIEYQGPRSRKFISGDCGEDIADPDTMDDYIEVYGKKNDESEVIELVADANSNDWQFVDFSEVECGDCIGRISVASIDPQTGLIFLQRESSTLANTDNFHVTDDDYANCYPKKMRGQREYAFNPWDEPAEKKGWRKPRRNNRKTMPDNKVQRDNRALLGLVKVRCVEEEDFYETAVLLGYDLLDSLFSGMEFYDYEEEFDEVCA